MMFYLFTEQRDRGTDQNLWWTDCQDGEELAVRSTEFCPNHKETQEQWLDNGVKTEEQD